MWICFERHLCSGYLSQQEYYLKDWRFRKCIFREGKYVYIGSAQNNVEKRVERHLRRDKQLFWHIDYLLKDFAVNVETVFFMGANKAAECKVAEYVYKNGSVPVKSFGCSDCCCVGHLFKVKDYAILRSAMFEMPLACK